jgi:hypothetical protein
MNNELKRFFIKTSLLALGLLLVGFIVFKWLLSEYYLPVYWFALIFFYVLTLVVHAWQLRVAKKDLAKFTRTNMVMTFVKLLIYSTFTVICLAVSTKNAIILVIVIMVLYIVFTVVEVTSITRFARSRDKITQL